MRNRPKIYRYERVAVAAMKRRKSVTSAKAKMVISALSKNSAQNVTFKQSCAEFLKHCHIKGLSPYTIKFYEKELKQIRRAFAEIDAPLSNIRNITTSDIEKFIEYQQSLGRAVGTINSRLGAGRTFLNFCLRKGYVPQNPFDEVQRLKMRHEIGATFSKSQLKRLLNAPDITTFIGLRDLAIMLTFAHTGIRLKELTSLRVQDVSFEGKGAINVQQAKNRYGRRIPLTKRLKVVLRAYIEERGVLDTDRLFISVENQPLSARTIQDRLKYYGNITGVGEEVTVSPHAFRRTFCRLKVEAGVNIFVLQRLMGHRSLEVLRRYVEIYGKDLDEAIEKGFNEI